MLGLRNSIEAATTPKELSAAIAAAESPTGRWAVSTLADVAEFFGIAVSTTKGWSQEGMPNAGDGWNLAAIVRWRFARMANSDLTTVRKQQEIELNAIAIEQKRLDLDREKGELLARDDVELWASVAIICCRETLCGLPESLATSCPHEIRDLVREETDRTVRNALSTLRRKLELAQLNEELAIGAADGNDDEPKKEESTDEQDA